MLPTVACLVLAQSLTTVGVAGGGGVGAGPAGAGAAATGGGGEGTGETGGAVQCEEGGTSEGDRFQQQGAPLGCGYATGSSAAGSGSAASTKCGGSTHHQCVFLWSLLVPSPIIKATHHQSHAWRRGIGDMFAIQQLTPAQTPGCLASKPYSRPLPPPPSPAVARSRA